MKRIRSALYIIWLIVISGFMFTFQSCDEDAIQDRKEQKIALDTYNKVIKYARSHRTESGSGCRVGYVKGFAKFSYGKSSIAVTYSVLQEKATERGALKIMSVLDEDDPRKVHIYGLWSPEGSGAGAISIFLSKDDFLCVNIEGHNWEYWDNYKLDSPDYVLKVFADASKKIARLENNSREARELAREKKREQRKRANVKTPLQEGVYYVLDNRTEENKNGLPSMDIIMPINGGKEFYDYVISWIPDSNGKKHIMLELLAKFAVVGNGEFRVVEKYYEYSYPYIERYFQRMRADNNGNLLLKWKKGYKTKEETLFVKTGDLSPYNIPEAVMPTPEEVLANSHLAKEIQGRKYTLCESCGDDMEGYAIMGKISR